MDQAAIARRIRFLLDEAKSPNPVKDQTVTMALRVISNVVTCGRDVSSSQVKDMAKFISKEALRLKEDLLPSEYYEQTINEHPDELRNVWAWIRDSRGDLTVEQVLERLRKWPMVVVSADEDAKMRLEKKQTPQERYSGIDILELLDGKYVPWKKPS